MRYFKMLGLTAISAAALLAFGAGSASAAEPYSTGVKVANGTTAHSALTVGTTSTTSTTDGKTLLETCTKKTIEGKMATFAGITWWITINTFTQHECTATTDTLTNGRLEIDASGTVTGNGTVWTVNFGGVSCRYGFGGGTHLGTLTTGTLAINAVINEQEPKSFICPDTTKWVASQTFTSPHDLTSGV